MAMKRIVCAALPLLLTALPTQAVTLEQLNQQVQQINKRISEQGNKLRINGFASLSATISDEEVKYNDVNDEVNFNRFSKVGLQMSFKIDDDNSVVTQLVSRGENEWNTKAEWVYFKHQFSNNFSMKAGRIRTPAYMLSEYLDIGYAVPWAQMPAETYSALEPFSNMDGFDLTYGTDIGDNLLSVQFAYGQSSSESFALNDILSLSSTFQADTWSARVAYAISSLDVVDATLQGAIGLYGSNELTGITGTFTSAGVTYDPGNIYFTTEYTQIEVDEQLADIDAVYATFGYRIGRWMPALTYAIAESQDDKERTLQAAFDNNSSLAPFGSVAGLQAAAAGGNATAQQVIGGVQTFQAGNNYDTNRIGLSLRYDMMAGTALKVQYDIIDAGDVGGLFTSADYATAQAANNEPDSVNMLTVSIDTVF
ncbi:hypothetical protein ACU6U9_00955 [Pseudomonas sp. HK3]